MYLPRWAYDLFSEACSFNTSSTRAPQLGRLILTGTLDRAFGWDVRSYGWLSMGFGNHANAIGQLHENLCKDRLIA